MGLHKSEKQKASRPSRPKLLKVKVIPRAKNPGVLRRDDGVIIVRVKAPPQKGQANREVLERLASFLGRDRSHLQIQQGHTSRIKIIAVKE